ncbi:DUF1778 domain-containing protein [Pandoraea oxalativorans]|uniref:Toxin-antitoxin system protein n=1 Tax=Pandoraea oxalativorans TaxID=573737 RepID=A0A0G3IDM4_9BURK|nr:DUF1778 domain-containing protein [Pandoraea oxalativorans]AKK24723.1 hypothetical protein MB84_28325 [Pandoraea oxalativorans]
MNATARFEARIPTEVRALLEQAADIQGRSMSDFAIAAIWEAATKVIEQTNLVRLSVADQHRFFNALLSPAEPAPALMRGAKKYRQLQADE